MIPFRRFLVYRRQTYQQGLLTSESEYYNIPPRDERTRQVQTISILHSQSQDAGFSNEGITNGKVNKIKKRQQEVSSTSVGICVLYKYTRKLFMLLLSSCRPCRAGLVSHLILFEICAAATCVLKHLDFL